MKASSINASIVTLLLGFTLIVLVPAIAQLRLQGVVEHSESLSPVDSSYKIGAEIDRRNFHRLVPNLRWYKVPNWAVGTWKAETLTTYYRHDYATGKTDTTEMTVPFRSDDQEMGTQMDSQGNIWDFDAAPYVTDVDLVYGHQTQQIDLNQLVKLSDKEMVNRLRSVMLETDLANKILAVYQAESVQTYTPYGKDLLRCVSSVKRFDDQGKAIELVQNVCAMRRIKGFVAKNTFNGIDLKASFKTYLVTHKLNYLMPGYERPSPEPAKSTNH